MSDRDSIDATGVAALTGAFQPFLGLIVGGIVCLLASLSTANVPQAAGNADAAGALVLLAGDQPGAPARLVGPDARLQLVATAQEPSGNLGDWTRRVRYTVEPGGVVEVDARGLITPLANGAATITAAHEDLVASVQVTVERFEDPPPVGFVDQVVPVLSKLGCNGGGCHGKSGGQNGFALSLFGYEPEKDYEYLVKEGRGRRLFPTAPDSSLLLLKGANILPHGGGERLKLDSADYRVLRRWIAQGMPYGSASDPTVTGITVYPRQRTLERDGTQQLKVLAIYSDGSVQDVTHTAQYEPNDKELAAADAAGLVTMLGTPGDVAIMARYQTFVETFRATVPLGAPVVELPPVRGFIDELVFAKLRELGMPPSAVADDATFIRRVTLDMTGRLPDPQRVREFLADASPDKRDRYIDELLDSTHYADYFAGKWTAILRNKRSHPQEKRGAFAFHRWVRDALHENRPYDWFVRELLSASGRVGDSPPVAWYRQVHQVSEQVEDTAQLFLGVRIQCARCHHHPFEKWSQDDYYGLAAFFSRVGVKGSRAPALTDEYRIFHRRGAAQSQNPATGKVLVPRPLGAEPLMLAPEQDPRQALASWMAAPENPFFARSLVNRYWKHFLGRGLVEPEDDIRDSNPPSNPQLLDALAEHFVRSGYDLKELVRAICRSSTYQLSSVPNEHNGTDRQAFSRYYPRRLVAEVLLDAIDGVNATVTEFADLPKGTRAVQLPEHTEAPVYFLQVFGRPAGSSACECERTDGASLAQSLHLLNSADMHAKISSGRSASLAGDESRTDAQKIEELYLRALSRAPTASELAVALAHIERASPAQRQAAYEDIVWALINTKEFLFNH